MVAPGRFLLGHFYWAKISNLFSSCSWDKIIFLKTLVSYQLNAESFWVQELLFMLEVRVKENIPVYLAQNKSKSLKKPGAALTKCCRKWVCGGESAWLQRRMFSIPVDSNHFNSIVSWSRAGSMWFCPLCCFRETQKSAAGVQNQMSSTWSRVVMSQREGMAYLKPESTRSPAALTPEING